MLARMDCLHYEGLLADGEEKLRDLLFEAVCKENESQMKTLFEDERLARIIEMEGTTGNTIINRGKRTLSYIETSGKGYSDSDVRKIGKAIQNGDTESLRRIFKQKKMKKTNKEEQRV